MAASRMAQAPSSAWRAALAGSESGKRGRRAVHCGMAWLLAQIRLAHLGICQQIRRAVGERDQSALHDVAAMAGLERELRVLLHQQQRHALGGDCAYGLEN